MSATPIPGTIVVNIGDLMSFWSGGRYKATPHRVIITDPIAAMKDRFSVAMFLHPNRETKIIPYGSKPDGDRIMDDEKQVLTAGEHINHCFIRTYKYKQNQTITL